MDRGHAAGHLMSGFLRPLLEGPATVGTGFRVYVFEEDGTLLRIPHTDYTRLRERTSAKRLQQFAGREIRVAHAGVELHEGQVMDVSFVEFQKFQMDEEGRWPEAERERHWRLSADSVDWSFLGKERDRGNVVEAIHRFAGKRRDSEFRWEPTRQEIGLLLDAIFSRRGSG